MFKSKEPGSYVLICKCYFRAKQMAVTKLKVTIQELLINIDEAVNKADFLKALV